MTMCSVPDVGRQPCPDRHAGGGAVRQTIEFLVALAVGILLFRTFAAEAYVVPTGSMAPTLLGMHEEVLCPDCRMKFALGLDEDGRTGRPVCPNCGRTDLEEVPSVACNGDRLLVQKFLYDVRRPRRWEVAVFHFPGDPSQAYVKRVVGLPGESVQIIGGNVYVDGRIARKTLREQRAMRVPVYDSRYVTTDADREPRFIFRRGAAQEKLASGWQRSGNRLIHDSAAEISGKIDWAEYRHWDPDRGRYAPIYDFNSYNGGDLRGENRVDDLMVEVEVEAAADVEAVELRIDSGADRFIISVPFATDHLASVRRNGRPVSVSNALAGSGVGTRKRTGVLEASIMDRRLSVALDGMAIFDPIDYDDPLSGPGGGECPVAVGVKHGELTVERFRVYRDLFYTGSLAGAPRRPFGVDTPFHLGADEFFVLGDNSPVSNDSRFWSESPVVPGELFLGKPFLVHLPGQVIPLRVFGRSLYWVPDPREIRYIR